MAGKTAREQLGVELQDPQQIEVEQVPAQEVEEPQRPEWLPEKFKDENEFANSYKTLEDELRRRGEEQNRMQAQLSQMQILLEEDREMRQQQPQGNEQQLREQLMASYESDPIGTMAYLAQQYASQTIDARLQAMQQENTPAVNQQMEQQNQILAMTVDRALQDRHNDWTEYKSKVAEEIQQDPSLLSPELLSSPEATIRQLDRIYENVKAREILSEAQNGNFVENSMKRRAQTMSGSGARPPEGSEDDEHFSRLMAAARGMSYAAWRDGGG